MLSTFKVPKDNDRYRWTRHVVRKMMHYRLTPSRVLRIVRAPERLEEGVAPGTLAGLQTAGTKTRPSELWAMWKEESASRTSFEEKTGIRTQPKRVIITAWRYPGTSPVRSAVPIPDDVLAELDAEGLLEG